MSHYAIVTGAAKGIGRSIARELAAHNYNLLLADIDEIRLFQAAQEIRNEYNVSVHLLEIDLSEDDAPERLKHWSKQFHNQLKIVVNNAGYGLNGSFSEMSLSDQLNIINLNIKTVVGISHHFIPVLNKQSQAYLLNVGSTTSYQTVPYLNIYASTKAFILSFTRGLRYELRRSNVSVSCLSPGSTDTDFVNRAKMGEATRKTAKKFNMSADEVARVAVDGLFRGKAEIVPGFTNKLNAFLPKFFPKAFVERIAGNIYEPKDKKNVPSSSVEKAKLVAG